MKGKTPNTNRYLSVCVTLVFGLTLPQLLQGHWLPLTAQFKQE